MEPSASDEGYIDVLKGVESTEEIDVMTSNDDISEQKAESIGLLEKFKSLSAALHAIEQYQQATGTRYYAHKKEKALDTNKVSIAKILFADFNTVSPPRLEYDGIPFTIIARKYFECTLGIDYDKKRKEERLSKNFSDLSSASDHSPKNRRLSLNTKKTGCTSTIHLREVIFFPDYKDEKNTDWNRRLIREKIKKDFLEKKEEFPYERSFVVKFPHVSSHRGHLIGEHGGLAQMVDKRLIERIHTLVGEGFKNVRDIQQNLDQYVRDELFKGENLPPGTSSQFFPKSIAIRYHMYTAFIKSKFSKIDQENLDAEVERWAKELPGDSFYFRGYGRKVSSGLVFNKDINDENEEVDDVKLPTEQKLLFVHQNHNQKHLLNLYGNHLCLLDATCKTTRYSIPLFFVVVRTNVDYQVVGSFATQDETANSISEALSILKSWNIEWQPKCFMVDNSKDEINAIENIFPDCKVFLCDFHREQAWERWLSKNTNGMQPIKDVILICLKRIADSETEEVFQMFVNELQSSDIWNADSSKKFRTWLTKIWFPVSKKWVTCYRLGIMEVAVYTNGVERRNRDFKYEFLKPCKDKSLSAMLNVLIHNFLPETFKTYIENNQQRSSRLQNFSQVIPSWMRDKPKEVVDHLISIVGLVDTIHPDNIVQISTNIFRVCEDPSLQYEVSLGDDDEFPYCGCLEWKKYLLPCKHIMAILFNKLGFCWESLSRKYLCSPYLNLDEFVIASVEAPEECETEPAYDYGNSSNEDSVNLPEIPIKKIPNELKASKCRDLLQHIKSMSFLINDSGILDNLEERLTGLVNELSEIVPRQVILNNKVINNKIEKKPPNIDFQISEDLETSEALKNVGISQDDLDSTLPYLIDCSNRCIRKVGIYSEDCEIKDSAEILYSLKRESVPVGTTPAKKKKANDNKKT